MRLETARDQFLSERRLGSHGRRSASDATLIRYKGTLDVFCDWVKFTQRRDSVLLFKSELARDYIAGRSAQNKSMNTLAVDCAVLREFARWGAKKRYWRAEDVDDLPTVQKPLTIPRALTPEERDRVMALELNQEDGVFRALLYYTGCRGAEILSLRLRHIRAPHPLPDGTTLPGALLVFGKGRKERTVPIHPALWVVLEPHIRSLAGRHPDHPILSKDGGPWSKSMVHIRLKKWRLAAKVSPLTAHQFRHTMATDLLDADTDLRTIQEILGHTHLGTTEIYTRVRDSRKDAAIFRLPTFTVQSPDSVIQWKAASHET